MLGPDLADGALPHFEGWVTLEKLGEGGMCAVYRARPEQGGEDRAIKLLTDGSTAAVRRFTEEARMLQRLDHPNVVKVHAIAADVRPPWLVMDLLGGRDLEQTMRVEGALDPERAARMFADLASALAAVHAAGVRHRDVKPANLRLGSDGIPRLIDFGIARDANATRVTRAGMVVGTASYLPPEIFVEEDANLVQDSEAADVYALGQTLCELLAGRPVHGGQRGTEASSMVRIMRDKLDREFLDPRDLGGRVPEALATIVRHATMREPAKRLQTAAAFELELRGWLSGRQSAVSVAPLTRIDPGAFPVLGTLRADDREVPPLAPPLAGATQATTLVSAQGAPPRPITPSPAPGRSVAATAAVGAVGAMGIAGIGLVAAGAVVSLVLLGFAAWTLVGDDEGSRLVREVEALSPELARCRASEEVTGIEVTLTVVGHRTDRVTVLGDPGGRSSRCVERTLQRTTWSVDGPVTVKVPVRFR